VPYEWGTPTSRCVEWVQTHLMSRSMPTRAMDQHFYPPRTKCLRVTAEPGLLAVITCEAFPVMQTLCKLLVNWALNRPRGSRWEATTGRNGGNPSVFGVQAWHIQGKPALTTAPKPRAAASHVRRTHGTMDDLVVPPSK